jgi:hypothetical protein
MPCACALTSMPSRPSSLAASMPLVPLSRHPQYPRTAKFLPAAVRSDPCANFPQCGGDSKPGPPNNSLSPPVHPAQDRGDFVSLRFMWRGKFLQL